MDEQKQEAEKKQTQRLVTIAMFYLLKQLRQL